MPPCITLSAAQWFTSCSVFSDPSSAVTSMLKFSKYTWAQRHRHRARVSRARAGGVSMSCFARLCLGSVWPCLHPCEQLQVVSSQPTLRASRITTQGHGVRHEQERVKHRPSYPSPQVLLPSRS